VQGNPQIIAELNKLLKNELTAINQYFLHARMMEHWGFERLGKKIYEESIGEMKHADRLIKRILFLDGLPNLQDLGRLGIGETVAECLQADLQLETAARTDVVAAIAKCEAAQDFVSREIAVHILEDA
jgi:bacterioferritin